MFETSRAVLPDIQVMGLVYEVGARIDLPKDRLAHWGSPTAEGPYITSDHSYCYVVMERGSERERRRTSDLDELLYWVFEATTHGLAVRYELHHRNEKEDFRRIMFAQQLELLGRLDPRWQTRRKKEIDAILETHPFKDGHRWTPKP